jgi:thiamine-monophosphate kinase
VLLRDLGEWELLRRLAAFAPPGQFADDAALLNAPGEHPLVVNTDVLVEHVHFSDATMPPQALGWRAAAANLSDLAAMGCSSVAGITVGLVAPGHTPWAWVEGVYQGLAEALARYGGVLLGGDCSSGRERLLAVTALGRLGPAGGAIRRGDGRHGDVLVSTGPHGLSRLGLALLLKELPADALEQLSGALQRRAIAAHQRPQPRLDAVAALQRSRPAGLPWRVGGTDSSDGLAAAVAAIAAASGCGAVLERAALPLEPGLAQLEAGERWCLSGGEDFELVLALEPAWAEALLQTLPGASWIGALAEGTAGELHWQDGAPLPAGSGGFCHFR